MLQTSANATVANHCLQPMQRETNNDTLAINNDFAAFAFAFLCRAETPNAISQRMREKHCHTSYCMHFTQTSFASVRMRNRIRCDRSPRA
jgi:hypothetical protein